MAIPGNIGYPRLAMQHRILLSCLVLSGFTGLSYELLWVRLLSASFGSTTLSFSTVLAVFFGGLALGSWLAARNLHRFRNPVRAYAFIELITGLAGVALYPVLTRLPEFFALIDPGPNLAGALTRFLVAMPVLLVPTVLMGATLPLVCAGMIRDDSEIGRGTALIYGFNTLGAFLGVYLVTYHLLHTFGVWQSILVTALVNLLVFGIAFREGRSFSPRAPSGVTAPEVPRGDAGSMVEPAARKLITVATGLTFLTGFSFICFEVVWARLFSLFLGGTIFGVGSVLICFLVGIALGSILIAPRADGVDAGRWFVGSQIVSAAGVLLVTALLPRVSYELTVLQARPDKASLVPQHLQLAVVLFTLAVPTIASGAAFPLLVRAITPSASQSGRSLGVLYSSNTIGSIAGSLLTGFILIPIAGSEATVYLGLFVTVSVAAIGAMFLMREVFATRALAAALACLTLLVFPGLEMQQVTSPPSSQASYLVTKNQREQSLKNILYFAEGTTAVVTVIASAGQIRGLSLNGLGQGGVAPLPPRYPLESALVAFVPLVHAPAARSALVVGFGAGSTVDLLAKHGLESVTVLELEGKVIDSVETLYQGPSPVDLPNVKVEVNDARHFLLVNQRRGGARFDILTSMPAHPWVAAPIFTREFFELARANLTPNGVFSTWFGVGGMDTPALQSVVGAFMTVFPNYIVYWVPEAQAYFLVGSEAPIQLDVKTIAETASSPEFEDFLELKDSWFLPARVVGLGLPESKVRLPDIINTDDSAFIETHSPRSSTVPAILGDLLPIKALTPEVFPPGDRAHYLELLEVLLGTRGGQTPLSPQPTYPARAKATIEALGERLFGPADLAYLRGRVALMEGNHSLASKLLEEAAVSDSAVVRARAHKFRTLASVRDPAALTEALSAMPFSSDIATRLLDLDRARAVTYLATSTTTLERATPLEWSLRVLSGLEQDPARPVGSREFYSRLRDVLGRSPPRGLAEECERFARLHGLNGLANSCASLVAAARQQQRTRLISEARSHGGAKRFAEAARALQTACEIDYRDLTCLRLLLVALMESSQGAQLEALLERAELHHPRAVLDAVLAGARASSAAGKSFTDDASRTEEQ